MKQNYEGEGVGATAFDLANNQNPQPHAPIYYGSTPVPTPCNEKAKITNHSAVMDAVLRAK